MQHSKSKRLLSGLQARLNINERLFELPEHKTSLSDDLLGDDYQQPMKMASAQVVGVYDVDDNSEEHGQSLRRLGSVHTEITDEHDTFKEIRKQKARRLRSQEEHENSRDGMDPPTLRLWAHIVVSERATKYGTLTTYWPSKIFEVTIFIFVVLNIIFVLYDGSAVPGSPGGPGDDDTFHNNGNGYQKAEEVFTILSFVIFTLEYGIRIWCCVEDTKERYQHPLWGRLRWARKPLAILDLVCLVPFAMNTYLYIVPNEAKRKHSKDFIALAQVLRMLRLFSFLKLERATKSFKIITQLLKRKSDQLLIAFYAFTVLISVSAIMMYVATRVSAPDSPIGVNGVITDGKWTLGECLYWAFITMTTGAVHHTPSPHHSHSFASPLTLLRLTTRTPSPHHSHSFASPLTLLRLTTHTPSPHHSQSFASPLTLLLLSLHSSVGYGDLYPQNYVARCVAAVSACFGIATVALLSGIFGSGFVELYEEDKAAAGELGMDSMFHLPQKIHVMNTEARAHRREVQQRMTVLETSVQNMERSLLAVLEQLENRR
jgi:hypothetical protein